MMDSMEAAAAGSTPPAPTAAMSMQARQVPPSSVVTHFAYLAAHAGDPTATAGGPGPAREWRLLSDPVDQASLLLADDKPHADHEALTADGVAQAYTWASALLADAGVVCHGWTARVDGAMFEYVADLTGECRCSSR